MVSISQGSAPTSRARVRNHISSYGGRTILGFMVARFFGSMALLSASLATPWQDCEVIYRWKGYTLCLSYTFPVVFFYSSVLGIIALVSKDQSRLATRLNIVLLLLAMCVYTYRDIWPLATYDQTPADAAEGHILWSKISLLAFIAIFIPLFCPRPYIPVDPKNPMPIPNPEQTSSWISRVTYTYIDSVILLANRVSHLSYKQLPPLSDYDAAKYQAQEAFPHLDTYRGAKRRHLFFGMVYHFRKREQLAILCPVLDHFLILISVLTRIRYMETGGANATVKPWLWILMILMGPVFRSMFQHWDLYIETVILVRTQAVLTQLVFEHSLRIRLKAEAPSNTTAVSVTDSVSDDEDVETIADDSSAEGSTVQASTSRTASSKDGSSTPVSVKGKSKATDKEQAKPSAPKKHAGDAENLLGRINNLVTSDLDSIVDGAEFPNLLIYIPLQITFSIIFLSKVLGWSALVGLITLLVTSPLSGYMAKWVNNVQETKMKKTDARVQTITESINVIRMIKLFGWENRMSRKLDETREEELRWIWKMKVKRSFFHPTIIPSLAMLLTYAAHTVIMKENLTASKIFSSMAVFSILRDQIGQISWQATTIIEGKVSLDRLTHFLHNTEVLDRFTNSDKPLASGIALPLEGENAEQLEIGFRNATFAWSLKDADGTLTPSSRSYRLRVRDTLLFKRNCINLIVGPTGSGKTSIIMALLGEMHFIPTGPDSWFNLPRLGGVAYAAQESWVQSTTIKENILFGSPYDEERYKKVIYQCALKQDLELFEAGDATEVGERGLTLSGGQKTRVTLARAIYSSADIVLLDDIFAALDVHTSTWILNRCLRGDLVKGRTIILVTHNIALVGPVAKFVVSIKSDGSISSAETVTDLVELAPEIEQLDIPDPTEGVSASVNASGEGKLVVAEEIAQGHITWRSLKLLVFSLGGRHPVLFYLALTVMLSATQVTAILQTWFLGVWGAQYESRAPSEVSLPYYLGMFSTLIFGQTFLSFGMIIFYNYRTVVASRVIHAALMESVFGSTFRWLDETPIGRIIARCTQDIRTVDTNVVQSFLWVIDQIIGLISKLGAIVLFTPIFVIPGVVVAIVGTVLGSMYLRAQLSIKREMSNARSPLLAHFNAAIHGLVSIRAYGAQQAFKAESLSRIDHFSRIARSSWNVNRWVGLRTDFLGAFFTASLAFYQVYIQNTSASDTGFSLNMAIGFCTYIFWLIRIFNNFEIESNSLERIQSYIDIDHEPKATSTGVPPASWPTSGDLRVENLTARYSQTSPEVLHGLSFHIHSGERIGIVGRTGSGKSSLTLALLRCILTGGKVYFDGLPTDEINLEALRSSITIIPQTPELLSGTLRQNLDPFEQHSDAKLNDALRSAGLFSLQEEAGEARLTLDSKIAGSGSNLSVGQRQIIALARAMVRESKLLILDEATSAIDYKTDEIIQNTLRTRLDAGVTVITVAHRLQTIIDADKIMVLDNGNIVEFGAPQTLLRNENGFLRAMVDGSGDKEKLYELAGGV
ncbi:ATP-binding cassette transporter abc4 [Psilocybe cubensis]|uniref:ATP-binding cassette transporter abc4 n=1 Tax=Psilocybe cubensis TaxID=181762 RepID=A0ACB8GZA0_PSICU|nr:ATP-binding cassette transporter abc4 [Psilocybe cubensis]KAH9480752.1 ATP-binding cassette transporter abc4 [Psilocybe cubensis]